MGNFLFTEKYWSYSKRVKQHACHMSKPYLLLRNKSAQKMNVPEKWNDLPKEDNYMVTVLTIC